MEQCWVYTPLNNSHPKRGRHEIRDEETQLEEKPVRTYEGSCHSCGQAGVDPGYGKKGMGWLHPKRKLYNTIYKKTTFSLFDLFE